MKDTNFDFDAFDTRVYENYLEFQGALQKSKESKGDVLIQTNYFQSVLKNSMECMLQSKEARRIPVKLIISILEDKKILTPIEAKDAMKICDIRDMFAHSVNLKSTEAKADKLIRTIDLGFTPTNSNDIILRAIEAIRIKSLSWDLYHRIDHICYKLIGSISEDVYELREPNPLMANENEEPHILKPGELDEILYHSNNDVP